MCVLCSDLWDPFPMFTLKKSYIINVHCETQWLCIIICEEYVKKRAYFTLFPPYSLCTGSGSKGTKVDICVCRWKQINLEGIFPTKMKLILSHSGTDIRKLTTINLYGTKNLSSGKLLVQTYSKSHFAFGSSAQCQIPCMFFTDNEKRPMSWNLNKIKK